MPTDQTFPGGYNHLVGDHCVESQVGSHFAEEFEFLIANFRQVFVGVEAVGGFRALRFEGLDFGEIRIGQEFVAECDQLL